jgi:hypothetical protein
MEGIGGANDRSIAAILIVEHLLHPTDHHPPEWV